MVSHTSSQVTPIQNESQGIRLEPHYPPRPCAIPAVVLREPQSPPAAHPAFLSTRPLAIQLFCQRQQLELGDAFYQGEVPIDQNAWLCVKQPAHKRDRMAVINGPKTCNLFLTRCNLPTSKTILHRIAAKAAINKTQIEAGE